MPPSRSLAAIVLAASASRALAGPELACPDGPDPLRFRAERPLFDVADEPDPLSVAGSVDPATASESVAVAYLTPGHDVAVAISPDGGCTFLAPVTVSSSGAVVSRPAIALRRAAPPLVAVAWSEAGRVVARCGPSLDALGPAVDLETTLVPDSPPRLSVTQQGSVLLGAAWIALDGGRVARAALTATGADAASWTADRLVVPGDAADVDVACDLAGLPGQGACAVLAANAAGEAWILRRDDPASPWGAARRIDDGLGTSRASALAAGGGAGPRAWVAAAWTSEPSAAPGTTAVTLDAQLVDAGAIVADFEGAGALPNAVLEPAAAARARPAVAVAGVTPAAFAAFESAGEVHLARRLLQEAGARVSGGCGPGAVTGISPPRSTGGARAPAASALGDDVALAFVDDRDGRPQAWFKRSDSRAPAVTLVNAAPSGCGEPPRVDLGWTPLPCDAALVTVEVGSFAGATDFTRVTAPASALSIEGLQPGTGYFFRLRVRDTAGNEQVSNEVSALLPSCSGALLRAEITTVADACAAGGAGGDGLVDPGETLRLGVRVRNDGGAVAPAARARVVSRSGFVTVRSPGVDLGDVAPGASVDVAFDLDVSATAPCGSTLGLLLRSDVAGAAWGDLVALDVPGACTPCRLPACAVTADASRTAPREICLGGTIALDAGGSAASDCAGTLLYEWRAGGTLVGTGSLVQQVPQRSVTYELTARCSTDFACEASSSVDVVVHPPPTITIAQDPPPPSCAGDVVTLLASSDHAGTTFAWSDGTPGDRLTVTASGLYAVTGTDLEGCRRSRTFRVDLGDLPLADAGPDVSGCGARVIGTPGYPLLDYAWAPPDGLSDPSAAQPVARPASATTYTLTVTDPLTGCFATDQVTVSSVAGPGPVRSLRVSRSGPDLALGWDPVPGASTVRAYADADARRAASANGSSPTARLLGDGALGCVVPLPPQPLLFLQAVAACADGSGEGPN